MDFVEHVAKHLLVVAIALGCASTPNSTDELGESISEDDVAVESTLVADDSSSDDSSDTNTAGEDTKVEWPADPADIESAPSAVSPIQEERTEVSNDEMDAITSAIEVPASMVEDSVTAAKELGESNIDAESVATVNSTQSSEEMSPEATMDERRDEVARELSAPVASENVTSESIGQYVVRPGDTLTKIAHRIFGDASAAENLAKANGLDDPNLIYPGDVIRFDATSTNVANSKAHVIPNPKSETIVVQKGDTLSKIAQKILGDAGTWKYLWRLNQSQFNDPNVLSEGTTLTLVYPTDTSVGSH